MSDAIASDHFIVSPAVVLEQQLFSMRLELEQIKNAVRPLLAKWQPLMRATVI